MTVDVDPQLLVSPDVYCERLGDDLVLFSANDRRLHVLNPTAARVWDAMRSPRSFGELVADVAEEYGVSGVEIVDDVATLIERFDREGLCDFRPTVGRPIGTGPQSESRTDRESQGVNAERIGAVGAPLTLRALGVPVIMETDDVMLATELARVFAPLSVSSIDLDAQDDLARLQHIVIEGADGWWHIRRNGVHVQTVASRGRAVRLAVAECNSAPLAVVEAAVVLHSSAVELGGGVVLFPGVSNAGKSTLAAELLLRGHGYVTDEAAAVDVHSLAVRPFPKSICIEPGSQHLFPEEMSRRHGAGLSIDDGQPWDVDPRLIGAGRLSPGGPIAGVVFPVFDSDAEPSLRPVAPIEALRLLVANAFDFTSDGHRVFPALVRMAGALPCYVSVHRGGPQHLDQLESMFGSGE